MAKQAIIQFYKVIQDSQELGSDEDYMNSRLFFHIQIIDLASESAPSIVYENLFCNIRQPAGTDYETEPIEVEYPNDFDIKIPYFPFREAAEKCYRACVGSSSSGIVIEGEGHVRMRNNIFGVHYVERLSMPEYGGGWQFD